MAKKLDFDFRIATILLLIAVIPIAVGTWWLLKGYEDAYLELVGTRLSDTAETAFSAINGYLQNQIISAATLGEVASIREAVARGNQDLKRNLDEVRKSTMATESSWAGLAADAPQVGAVVQNPAADFLRRYSDIQKSHRNLLVTDFLGRATAATSKPKRYHYAVEEWWKETYGDGRRGAVYIGDVYWDGEAKANLMDIAHPLVSKDGEVVGVIRVTIDTQAIHALIGSFQAGTGASVGLIQAKGDVISAAGLSSLQHTTYPATLDLLTAREKGRRFFMSEAEAPTMFGLSQRNFMDLFPHLNWIVFATGKKADLVGVLPQMRTYFMLLLVSVILFAMVATLMLSRVESRPIVEEDPHLDRL